MAGTFSFRIVLAGADTFTLPIAAGGAGYTHNFTVHWDDGEADSEVTAYNDGDAVHNYAGAGTYDIIITGTCEWLCFNNAGDKLLVTEILSVSGDCGFKLLNFQGCVNITDIVALGTMASLTSAQFMFSGYPMKLAAIPANMFDGCTAIAASGFYNTFYGCTSLTSIPTDLFKFNVNVSTNGFRETFWACIGITEIPANLFAYNTAVTTNGFYQTFRECTALTTIGAGAFDNCSNVSSGGFYQTFYGCNKLTTIPSDLFTDATSTQSFAGTFHGCTLLATIGTDVFANCSSVWDFSECFYGCSSLTAIPSDLFTPCTGAVLFNSVFYGCSTLTTTPADLFSTCTITQSFQSAFQSCTGITTLGSGIFDNCVLVAASGFQSTFQTCTALTTVPSGIFDDCVAVSTAGFRSTFQTCTSLATVPANLFRYNIAVSSQGFYSTFYDCNKLQLHATIFYALGEEDTRFHDKSVDFSYCFYRASFTGTQGIAPDVWDCDFGTGTPTPTQCFIGAGNSLTSLTNYNSIPVAWGGPGLLYGFNPHDDLTVVTSVIITVVESPTSIDVNVSDSLTVSDTQSILIPVDYVAVADNLTVVTNTLIVIPILELHITDNLNVTTNTNQLLTLFELYITDNLSIVTSPLCLISVLLVAVTDDLTVETTETISIPILLVTVADSLTITDSIPVAVDLLIVNVTDSLTLETAIAIDVKLGICITDSLTIITNAIQYLPVLQIFESNSLTVESVIDIVEEWNVYGPFPDDWNAAENWANVNVRFIIPTAKLKKAGNYVQIGLAYNVDEWIFDHLYIGHPALTGDAYDFDGNQKEVTFGGVPGGTVSTGGLVSDWVDFNLDNQNPLIMAFYIATASSVPIKVATGGYSLYYKFATDETPVTDVTDYIQPADYYLRRFIDFVSAEFIPVFFPHVTDNLLVTTEPIFFMPVLVVNEPGIPDEDDTYTLVTDSVLTFFPLYEIHVTDSITVTPVVSPVPLIGKRLIELTDNLAVTTIATLEWSRFELIVTDNLTVDTNALLATTGFAIHVSDSLTIAAATHLGIDLFINVTDNLTIVTSSTLEATLGIYVSDSLSVTTLTTIGQIEHTYVTDNLTISDTTLQYLSLYEIHVSDDLNVFSIWQKPSRTFTIDYPISSQQIQPYFIHSTRINEHVVDNIFATV